MKNCGTEHPLPSYNEIFINTISQNVWNENNYVNGQRQLITSFTGTSESGRNIGQPISDNTLPSYEAAINRSFQMPETSVQIPEIIETECTQSQKKCFCAREYITYGSGVVASIVLVALTLFFIFISKT